MSQLMNNNDRPGEMARRAMEWNRQLAHWWPAPIGGPTKERSQLDVFVSGKSCFGPKLWLLSAAAAASSAKLPAVSVEC